MEEEEQDALNDIMDRNRTGEDYRQITSSHNKYNLIQRAEYGDVYKVKKPLRLFLNNQYLKSSQRQFYFIQFVKIMSRIGRNYLRNLKFSNKEDFDLMILSASIDNGLWGPPKYTVLAIRDQQNTYFSENVEQKFDTIKSNFMEALKLDLLKKVFGTSICEYAHQFFDELYVTFISILIQLNKEQEAMNHINTVIRICEFFKLNLVAIKLKMIKESLNMKYFNTMACSTLSECEDFFRTHKLKTEGDAELSFLRVLLELFAAS